MLGLPDKHTLRTWSDHADAPRVLVHCPHHLVEEASKGWPAWIALVDCVNFETHVEAIRAWRPDLVVTVVDPGRNENSASRRTRLRHMVWLNFNIFANPAKPLPSPTSWSFPIESVAETARTLRESCTTLVGGFFRPGVMCVDYADLRALMATDFIKCAMVTVTPLGTMAETIARVPAWIGRRGFQSQAVYSAIQASPSFSMQDHDEITAAIESAFPGLRKIGPAVPLTGNNELVQVTQVYLLIAGALAMPGSGSQ